MGGRNLKTAVIFKNNVVNVPYFKGRDYRNYVAPDISKIEESIIKVLVFNLPRYSTL